MRDADIHLQGGKVAAVSAAGSRLTVPAGTAELDVQQRIVTPGIVSACQCLVYVLCTLLLPLWSKSGRLPRLLSSLQRLIGLAVAGIVDLHNHAGLYPWPDLFATQDGNEMTGPAMPMVRYLNLELCVSACSDSMRALVVVAGSRAGCVRSAGHGYPAHHERRYARCRVLPQASERSDACSVVVVQA